MRKAVAHLKKQKIDATAYVCDIGKREAIAPFADAVLTLRSWLRDRDSPATA